ncbi:thiol-disulfide isomerase/thioredoxin [Nitrosospira sp. Nsp5]|uniref:Thiol-disulfide isomerase or thioredoxin n=2 Tax=Nitrosospira TaxID=35798 RepID=A0ABY0TB75_9PROT|nr:redoxin domain-containing protein [Nitrosospira multiformis]PTR08323.1 thiol-disulfide isomerase/thioredoxin [Nitrosospira sp. Nsp5]SDQ56641.1 Thiol-disulfide isomerase or thioredoxin [Nitrosospira multiformis]
MFNIFKSIIVICSLRTGGLGVMARTPHRPMMGGLLLVLALTFMNASGAAESVRPFTLGSLEKVLGAREDKPFILVFWSLDCQYCPTELKMLSELKRSHPALDVVLIATDSVSDAPQLIARTESYGMNKAEQWVFAEDMPERLRFEIDRRWYGEVPRTYFYDRKHQREAKTGLVSKKFFEDWIARNAVTGSGH